MRKGVAGLCSLCLTGSLLAGIPAPRASARAGVIDKELLGVRLLQSYKRVLQLYGQPTRIYRNDESVTFVPATDAGGKETGGVKGLEDGAAAGGGAPGGLPGSGGFPGSGGGSRPGNEGPPGGFSSSGGFPGSGGAPGSGGFPGGDGAGRAGGALGGAAGGGDKPMTFAESGGFIWVYYYPRDELAYRFAFNTDGRCISVWERGRFKGQPSERGIRLGDAATKVYGTYGWPDSVEQQTTNLVLNYNIRHHAQISLLNGKVIGIAVFLRESQIPHLSSGTGGAGGGGGAPAAGLPGSGGRAGGGRAGGGKGGGRGAAPVD